jgi:hypothetical protein
MWRRLPRPSGRGKARAAPPSTFEGAQREPHRSPCSPLQFHLPATDHDAGLAGVGLHPVQNSGRRTHWVGAIKFHSRSRASHGHSNVAAEHPITVLRDRKWPGERPEIRVGIVIASPRDSDVFGHYGVRFFLNCSLRTSSRAWKPMPIMLRPAPTASVFWATLFPG